MLHMKINDVLLEIKECNGNRVLSFKDIDQIFKQKPGTTKRIFNRERKQFTLDLDYYYIQPGNTDSISWSLSIPNKGIILITETGIVLLGELLFRNSPDDILLISHIQSILHERYFSKIHLSYQNPEIINTLVDLVSTLQQNLLLHKPNAKRMIVPDPIVTWRSKMFAKYKILEDRLCIDRKKLYHMLYVRLERKLKINLNELKSDYCREYGLNDCFTMQVIESRAKYREALEKIVDSLLTSTSSLKDTN